MKVQLYLNRELRNVMGANARKTFETRYLDETAVKEQADWLETGIVP